MLSSRLRGCALNKKILLLVLAVTFAFSSLVIAQEEEFAMANKFYADKDFDSAIRLYESTINQGYESAPLYFNLGNAYFKKGDLGHAILNYLKAKRLDPSDEDIAHNLEFAQRFSRIQMEGVQLNPIEAFLSSLVDSYHLNSLAWISSIFFILLIGVLIARYGIGFNNALVRSGLIIALTLVVISSGLTTFKYRQEYLTKRGVIIAENSTVYTGPSEQSDVELEGAPGLIVEILDDSGDYYNVLFENKRRGWVKKSIIAEI